MITFFPSGDSAFLMKFGNKINKEIHQKIRSFIHLISDTEKIEGITEIVPSYCDLMIHYNPFKIHYDTLLHKLRKVVRLIDNVKLPEPKTITIPVFYGGRYGIDMENVQMHTGLNKKQIIELHSQQNYLVYMLGFTPGFCYLGGMNPKLATPRKANPSGKILSGSVGIAANQTGIYPIDSPGGWQIIGRTPLKLFDPQREKPFLVEAGNYLTFTPITEEEYNGYNQNS